MTLDEALTKHRQVTGASGVANTPWGAYRNAVKRIKFASYAIVDSKVLKLFPMKKITPIFGYSVYAYELK